MQMIDVLKRLAELDAKNPNVVKQNVHEDVRLVGQTKVGDRSVKIYRDTDWNEFRVQFYLNGKHQVDADYHTDDKQDAMDTANTWLKDFPKQDVPEDGGISKNKETEFHSKLDTLVHNTFGKRKDEMEEDSSDKTPTVHDLSHMTDEETYNETQTNDDIKDGDILKLSNNRIAILNKAWPVMVSGESEQLHQLKNNSEEGWANLENGKYLKSYKMAMKLASGNPDGSDKQGVEEVFVKSLNKHFDIVTEVPNQNYDPNADEDDPNSAEVLDVGINYESSGDYYPATMDSPEEFPEIEITEVVDIHTGKHVEDDAVDWNELEQLCLDHLMSSNKDNEPYDDEPQGFGYSRAYESQLKEAIQECGDMMTTPTQPKTPASINMTAASGEELSNMLKDIMSLAGLHKVEPSHLGHEHEPAVISTEPNISTVSMNGDGQPEFMRAMLDKLNEPQVDVVDMDTDDDKVKEADNTPNETVVDAKHGALGVSGLQLQPNTPGAADGRGQLNNPRGVPTEEVYEQLMAEYKNFVSETNNAEK